MQSKTAKAVNLIVYNPVKGSPLTYSAEPGASLFRPEITVSPVYDGKRFWFGDLILGIKGICKGDEIDAPSLKQLEYLGAGKYKYGGTEYFLEPLGDMADLEYEETAKESRQILF